jgi:uncharacterized protein YbjQ (UPF0145 family)
MDGDRPDQAAAGRRRDDSVRSLEQGGLPLNALDRLREQAARQGTPRAFFTSDLSTNELVLVQQAGYQPLGQVMGSSIYHVGIQWTGSTMWSSLWSGSVSFEMDVLTDAYTAAGQLAVRRLQQEAALLGATSVVGVRLERKAYEWGRGLLEFAAIGTAVREAGPLGPRAAPGEPVVSNLSGQDFWRLREAGFQPAGLVFGNCVYYQIPSWDTQQVVSGSFFNPARWRNQELPEYTEAVYTARSLALGRMTDQARAVGAAGVVGTRIEVEASPREIEINHRKRLDMTFFFSVIGTAIAPAPAETPRPPLTGAVFLGSRRQRQRQP